MKRTHLLVVGAGPYGLAAGAYARHLRMDFVILGMPMEFWSAHMPRGMFLRSGSDWHLDAMGIHTFEAFLETRGLSREDVDPIPVDLFREYGCWFADCAGLRITPSMVCKIQHRGNEFEAVLEDGGRIAAENVLVTPGFRHFMNLPDSLIQLIPDGRYVHTCELTDFDSLKLKRCLIIGGRQSAFEGAALIGEAGAEEITIAYRHDTPRFERSEWEWINPMMDLTAGVRGWYRRLPADEREAIERRFWAEGRLKLEPWLASRIHKEHIKLMPHCSLEECREQSDGQMSARFSNGQNTIVDQIVLATGYKVNVADIPYLSRESIVSSLRIRDGFPVLDEYFQCSVPGLFMTGLPATRDFGPFFGFVKGCPTAARIIVDRILSLSTG